MRGRLGSASLLALALMLAPAWTPAPAGAFGERSLFHFAQLRYEGTWNPNPTAGAELMRFVGRYTSIRVAPTRQEVRLNDPQLFYYPFLYLTGCETLPEFSDEEIRRLRRYLVFGGLLLIDDCLANPEGPFLRSARALIKRVFPNEALAKLPGNHTLFQTYFLLEEIGGRRMAGDLEAVLIDDRAAVVVSPNDLGGAWARSYDGGYVHECLPGGERQRQMAYRVGLNIVMYSLTVDYKKDQVHLPFILKRRR